LRPIIFSFSNCQVWFGHMQRICLKKMALICQISVFKTPTS
jgi:hypothetical protein